MCAYLRDEKNCRLVTFDPENYLKGKSPQPKDGRLLVEVEISINLLVILRMEEV